MLYDHFFQRISRLALSTQKPYNWIATVQIRKRYEVFRFTERLVFHWTDNIRVHKIQLNSLKLLLVWNTRPWEPTQLPFRICFKILKDNRQYIFHSTRQWHIVIQCFHAAMRQPPVPQLRTILRCNLCYSRFGHFDDCFIQTIISFETNHFCLTGNIMHHLHQTTMMIQTIPVDPDHEILSANFGRGNKIICNSWRIQNILEHYVVHSSINRSAPSWALFCFTSEIVRPALSNSPTSSKFRLEYSMIFSSFPNEMLCCVENFASISVYDTAWKVVRSKFHAFLGHLTFRTIASQDPPPRFSVFTPARYRASVLHADLYRPFLEFQARVWNQNLLRQIQTLPVPRYYWHTSTTLSAQGYFHMVRLRLIVFRQ